MPKKIILIMAAIVGLFALLLVAGKREIDAGSILNDQGLWTIVTYGPNGEAVRELKADAPEVKKLRVWLKEKENKWNLEFSSLVPGALVITEKGNLNITPRYLVLHAGPFSFSKSISREECLEVCNIVGCSSMHYYGEKGCEANN